jgi:hypothetical protein
MTKTGRKYWGCYQPMITTFKRVKLVSHNTPEQLNWGGHNDTETDLLIGAIYDVEVEVHSMHTKYFIGDKHYNSVCFEDVEPEK